MADKRGCVYFSSQSEAETYLYALPVGVDGDTFKSESGKWGARWRQALRCSDCPRLYDTEGPVCDDCPPLAANQKEVPR